MHLGLLAGQHEQLLGTTARGVVEDALDLGGAVEVRPVGREGAVLAVAAARPRQRERVVPRERDAAHSPGVYDPSGPGRAWAGARPCGARAQPIGSRPSARFSPGAMNTKW